MVGALAGNKIWELRSRLPQPNRNNLSVYIIRYRSLKYFACECISVRVGVYKNKKKPKRNRLKVTNDRMAQDGQLNCMNNESGSVSHIPSDYHISFGRLSHLLLNGVSFRNSEFDDGIRPDNIFMIAHVKDEWCIAGERGWRAGCFSA